MYSRLFAAGVTLFVAAAVPAQGFGAVYTTTNAAHGNEVAVALRLPGGRIVPFANFATGGDGTAAGLGSQAALAMSTNHQWLLAVNAGSDEVSLFRTVFGLLPWRSDVVASGGNRPISVAVHGDLVYVLNAGANNNVSGFRIHRGSLQPLANGTYALSQNNAGGGQVGFDPSGRFLLVTEKATNQIDVFAVRHDGTLGAIMAQASSGATPFGFQFAPDGTLVVSEAAGGAANASTVSSYHLGRDGTLVPLTASAPTMQTAACWIAIPPNGQFAYTTNFGSGSLSGYRIGHAGMLNLLDANGVTGQLPSGGGPLDADFDPSGRVLYVLDAGRDEVDAFVRDGRGELHLLPGGWAQVDGAAGLLAR